ncbi:TonB-dependent receptor [Reichenbachiella ulvae]|uniref:TonB-dependent receptor n=1 Tax=Reichenbachiella ulvae TaxID=2980104 RepID=A0ABT3CPA8_9BACT|nr:TonB-dependent receptor [Reichenbachiella ulvae]MCV9385571.1 TonB-dependent receptor [Reichenbachiella ulvae]
MTQSTLIILITFLLGTELMAAHVSGRVTDTQGEALPGVNVYIKDSYDGATTDLEGRFSFSTSESGEQTLIASSIGFRAYESTINLNGDLTFQIQLREEVNRLSGVTITAGSFEASDEKKSTILKPLDIAMTAGAAADIPGVLNMLPGTTTNGETGRLFVRGGTANETQAFVDGIWVNNFYSTTANNVPSRSRFDPFLFKGTFFSTGGYSAEYGQALSSVLSLNSLDLAEETLTDIGVMTIGGDVAHTQRWDEASLYGKVQYTNLDPYMNLVDQQYEWKDGPTSINGTMMYRQRIKGKDMLKVFASYDQSDFHAVIPSINNPGGNDMASSNRNAYLNATYKKPIGDHSMAYAGLSYGKYDETTDFNSIDIMQSTQSVHGKSYFTTDVNQLSVKVGGEWIYQGVSEDTELSPSEEYKAKYDNSLAAGFSELDYYLTNDLTVRAGLRYAYYSAFDQAKWSPRVSMAYKTGEYSQLSAAFGKFHQLPQSKLMLIGDEYISPEEANHYILSYQRITEGFTFRSEVYYKTYDQLVTYSAADPFNPTTFSNSGKGYARGLDLFFRDTKTIKNADYWISYSFIDSKRKFENYPDQARPDFTAMHNVSVVYKHFIPVLRTQVGASWNFNNGRPYNDPNDDVFNGQRTKFYSDLSFNFAYLYRQNIILYASASNLLGRDNVFGYEFENQPGTDGVMDARPIGQQAKRFFFVGLFISLSKDKQYNQLDKL